MRRSHDLHRLVAPVLLATLTAGAAPLAAQTGFGQSFTVPGAPNTVLQQLTVGARGLRGNSTGSNPFVVQLFALSGNTLVGTSLFAQVLGTSFEGFTIAPGLSLAAGGSFAVVVRIPDGAAAGLFTDNGGDVHAGGAALFCGVTTCNQNAGAGEDLQGFALQFGAASSTVPEPGAWALLGTGLLGVAGLARRRRRGR